MPRYFFEVHDGALSRDQEGTVLDDLPAARVAAAELAGSLLKDQAETFWEREAWRVDVKDERGALLFALHIYATEPKV